MQIILSIIFVAIVAGGLYYALRRPKDSKPLDSKPLSSGGGSGSSSAGDSSKSSSQDQF